MKNQSRSIKTFILLIAIFNIYSIPNLVAKTTAFTEESFEPTIICPKDITVDCTTDVTDTKITGVAEYITDIKNEYEVSYEDYSSEIDCGTTLIHRNWYYIDENKKTHRFCKQIITVVNVNINEIVWPENITICNCDLSAEKITPEIHSGEPNINHAGCSYYHSNYFDDIKTTATGELILRNWTVLNWCTGEVIKHVQQITFVCDKDPRIYCHSVVNISLDPNGKAILLPEYIVSDYAGPCGDSYRYTLSLDDKSYFEYLEFSCSDLGSLDIIVKLETPSGAIDICKAKIVVEDKLPICNSFNGNSNSSNEYLNWVYPNPTQGLIHIDFKVAEQQTGYLKIMDLNGKKITTYHSLEEGNHKISCDLKKYSFDSGVLLIEMYDGQNIQFEKIIIQ